MTTSTDPFDMTGKVAVVTGGSRGLGREMCRAFAAHGARIVVASRKREACDALAEELTDEFGVEALPVGCHVGNWAECDQLVETTLDRFGGIDVLVNNAGMSPLYPSLGEVSEALFDKVLSVNLKGPFRLSALAGEHMAANGGGSIINVSSTAALQPSGDVVPYGVAKAGLDTLTVALAHMFGPTVRANGIRPGPFLTDISTAWDMDAFRKRAETSIALARAGEPSEIVGAALYLASDASSYTTGTILKVDGGSTWAPA